MSDSVFGERVSVECEIGGRTFSLTTGEIAKQASGAVLVQYGESVLFVAAQLGPPRPGIDFFPLQVDYRERLAAAGRFAGGFLKREGRPTTREILTARVTDRPLRPLFPKGYKDEVQIQASAWAVDGENDPAPLCCTGASAALMLSPAPFSGPVASVRVGRIDGELTLFPTHEQMQQSDLDLVAAGNNHEISMIEGFANQFPEDEMATAIEFAHGAIKTLCDLQRQLIDKAGRGEKPAFETPAPTALDNQLTETAYDRIRDAKLTRLKQERGDKVAAIKQELQEKLFPREAETTADGATRPEFNESFSRLVGKVVRDILLDGKRLDGRAPGDLRPVDCQVSILPCVHGSALFTRGETQSVCTITLGTVRDKQRVDGLFGEYVERFMLHYYFPSYSVGEVRPIRGPGRREIGHGVLAERSVYPILPAPEKFPYTIRSISDITESNGSSSMASVCSTTLGLMDAGVPITQPLAGISIGLVRESDEKFTLLTDIMGDEDHYGDMDFKVAGTQKGITGIQLDLKVTGISHRIIRETLTQARTARIELLRKMLAAIRRPRKDVSPRAPRLLLTKIDPEKIGMLIGPGGKTIRAIQEQSGATIDVQDDGTVTISSANAESAEAAMARVEALAEDIKVGRIYEGTVSSTKDFGAFIEIAPGKDGLCHISELSDGYVKNVSEICKVGDPMRVKVIAVDEQNRVKLSRKAVLAEEAEAGGQPVGSGEDSIDF